jgi:nucleoside-diphosphate-sugar epimerase
MKQRILITGGAGFVGAALVRHALSQGAEVAILTRAGTDLQRLADRRGDIRFIVGDLANVESYHAEVSAFQPDVCFHLAWVTEPGKYLQSPLNAQFILYSIDLLRCLFAAGCSQIVSTGTCFEYARSDVQLTEDSPLDYSTPYASSKNLIAQICLELANRAGANFAWGRLFYMVGPADHPKRLLPSLIAALKQDRDFPTTDGAQRADYLHVRDVAAALWNLTGQHGVFNVCSGEAIAVRDLISAVADLMGKQHLVKLGVLQRPPDMPMLICGSRQKITQATGWTPEIGLEDGLRDVIEAAGT